MPGTHSERETKLAVFSHECSGVLGKTALLKSFIIKYIEISKALSAALK